MSSAGLCAASNRTRVEVNELLSQTDSLVNVWIKRDTEKVRKNTIWESSTLPLSYPTICLCKPPLMVMCECIRIPETHNNLVKRVTLKIVSCIFSHVISFSWCNWPRNRKDTPCSKQWHMSLLNIAPLTVLYAKPNYRKIKTQQF